MVPLLALTILVHVTNLSAAPNAVVRAAQIEARAIFRDAGVDVEFADDQTASAHADIRLILVQHADGALRNSFDAVLGAAARTPEGAGTAWVFYEMIAEHSERYVVRLSSLLACTIAHEIGHLLQPHPSHEERGVMRATWRRDEYRRAALGRLRFNSTDLRGASSAVFTDQH